MSVYIKGWRPHIQGATTRGTPRRPIPPYYAVQLFPGKLTDEEICMIQRLRRKGCPIRLGPVSNRLPVAYHEAKED